MTKRLLQIPRTDRPLLDIFSVGRAGPQSRVQFSPTQIEQIARTVRRTPEVMLKVTGGGATVGAVSAHLSYISRKGKLEIETDEGDRIGKEEQKALLSGWHLELSSGQYRGRRHSHQHARGKKLVYNIVLSMPAPTPPEKVLAAARVFAREKFAVQHRYAMVHHTDQQHPHVHLVVKAESEHGQRLHIDKVMLREWRQDFARMMREQGIAANATARFMRGRNRGTRRESISRAVKHGSSTLRRARVEAVTSELGKTGRICDPARGRLMETRTAVMASWMRTADALDAQGDRSGRRSSLLRSTSSAGVDGQGENSAAVRAASCRARCNSGSGRRQP